MAVGIENLPPLLEPLLQPTPSGVAKLLAAWDGLATETQILILTVLPKVEYPGYLAAKIKDKALASEVPYIRYLSYCGAFLNRDSTADMEVKARLEADPDPLVRYAATEESSWIGLPDAEKFLALPHEARLAKIRSLKDGGEHVAKIISHALDNHLKDGRVTEIELYEILADYVKKPSFRQHYERDKWRRSYDGYGEYLAGKDIEALWNLVPKCPANLAYLLIARLPPEAGLSAGIPTDVINALTDYQLQTLLYRPDIGLPDLRRDLFRDTGPDRDSVRAAAITWNFSIDNAEFAEILALPDKARLEALQELASHASDLRLCVFEALHDYLFLTDKWEDAQWADMAKERKLTNLEPGWHRDEELRQLRLYHLARTAAPLKKDSGGYPPSGELEFLAEHVIKADTWATFIAFESAWRSPFEKKALEKYLPRIDGVDPRDDVADIDPDDDVADIDAAADVDSELVVRLEHKLDRILAALPERVGDLDDTSAAEFASHDANSIDNPIVAVRQKGPQDLAEVNAGSHIKSDVAGSWTEYAVTAAGDLILLFVVGYVFNRLDGREEVITVSILGLIYVAVHGNGIVSRMSFRHFAIVIDEQFLRVRRLVGEHDVEGTIGDQIKVRFRKDDIKALIHSLYYLIVALVCTYKLFSVL